MTTKKNAHPTTSPSLPKITIEGTLSRVGDSHVVIVSKHPDPN
jgi:hypothetical protein